VSDVPSLARNFAMRDGASGFPAIGPGARAKSPSGTFLTDTARRRKAPKSSRVLTFCGSNCPGHRGDDEERCR